MEGYGALVLFALLFMAVIGIGSVVLFVMSIPWAFRETRRARVAYLVTLVLILLMNAYWFGRADPRIALRVLADPRFGVLGIPVGWIFMFATMWIVLGVPLIRWARHSRGSAGDTSSSTGSRS